MRSYVSVLFIVMLMSITLFSNNSVAEQPEFILIGTAGATGVYHPAGNAFCRLINKERTIAKKHSIHCSAVSSNGSVDNIRALELGEIDLAIVQTDVLQAAYQGTGVFKINGENSHLRELLDLYVEPVTVVVRADSTINQFDQLVGKRVNIGDKGSGSHYTMGMLMTAYGWRNTDFAALTELSSSAQSAALCEGDIDAFITTVGHPAGVLKHLANNCDVRLLNITGAFVDQLIEGQQGYQKVVIPAKTYRGNDQAINTLGVMAKLISTDAIDDKTITTIVENIMANLDLLRSMHPAFKSFTKVSLLKSGSSVPMHDGIMHYAR